MTGSGRYAPILGESPPSAEARAPIGSTACRGGLSPALNRETGLRDRWVAPAAQLVRAWLARPRRLCP
jgi:hypothetical protein